MADTTQVEAYKLLLEVQGRAEAEDLRVKLEGLQKQALKTAADLKAGLTVDAKGKDLKEQLQSITAEAQATQRALDSLSRAGGGGNSGRALLEVSRAAEDAQYGIAGVVNNIPGLVAALGGTAGLAGVASVVSIAVAQLVKHWGDLMGMFGAGKTQSEAAAMEELAKKTRLSADEAERLARFQNLNKKVDEVRGARTDEEKKTEDAVTKAFTELGKDQLDGLIAGLVRRNPTGFDAGLAPTLEADGKTVAQNGRGENRNALVDLRDAQRDLDDYKSGKSRRQSLGAKGEVVVDDLDPAKQQELEIRKAQAQRDLDAARREAALRQALTGALPREYQGGLNKLIGDVGQDPAALFGGQYGPAKKFLDALKAATPEARERERDEAEQAKQDNEAEDRRAKLSQKDLEAARKDKGLLDRDPARDTPEEAEARREHDAFESRVAGARRAGSYKDKEESDYTDEDKAARARDDRQRTLDDKADRARKAKERDERKAVGRELDDTDLGDQLDAGLAAGVAGGGNLSVLARQAKARLAQRLAEDYGLADEQANEEAEGRVRSSAGRVRGALGKADDRRSEVTGAEDYARRLLTAGLGNDETKKQTTLLERIAENTKGKPGVRERLTVKFE